MYAAVILQGNRLTLGDMLRGIPHDLPAIVIYVLLALFIGFIWVGNRNSGKSGTSGNETE